MINLIEIENYTEEINSLSIKFKIQNLCLLQIKEFDILGDITT